MGYNSEMRQQNRSGVLATFQNFFKMEASGGIVLVIAAALALVIANTPLNAIYNYVLNDIVFRISFLSEVSGEKYGIEKPLLLWINDGLMALFFFLVGLEIKREFKEGELSSRERALLPAIGALGGMAVPALIFWYLNRDNPANLAGWAIPAATDIAFALGVLALLGSRVPVSLKILLTAIAIMDDLGAIVIIALFYTETIKLQALALAAAALAGLAVLNFRGVARKAPYILLGFILWFAVLKSGVHATLAGVITAMFIPIRDPNDPDYSPSKSLEHALHPWIAFAILPVFGFANAGVPFGGITAEKLMDPVVLGIALGLFFGKQIGIFTSIWLAVKLRLSPMPRDASWLQIYALSILCGIGFTMSLFIGSLAYEGVEYQAAVRLGVLGGSIVAALTGYALFRLASRGRQKAEW